MTEIRQENILIMAGGTGGHIFPGIAVADELNNRGWNPVWLGSKGGMEEELVKKANIEMNLISVAGLRGKGIIGWLKAPFSLTKAVMEAVKILNVVKPKLVVGFGGFASGPGGLAAFFTRTPLVIHEQNAIAGLTNKVLAKFSKKVFQAFPGAFSEMNKLQTVGNPVRHSIEELNSREKNLVSEKPINILVVGGSRGALALNKNVPVIFKDLLNQSKVTIKHQVGKGRTVETEGFYQQTGVTDFNCVELCEFIDDMAEAFMWADIVFCRAGASTVSEIAAAGLCAVFVPFPYAVDDHQTANANWLVKSEAAICIQEKDMLNEEAINKVEDLVGSPEKINLMANKAREVAYLNAAAKVADYCDSVRNKAA